MPLNCRELQKCLRLHPDHPLCQPYHRRVATVKSCHPSVVGLATVKRALDKINQHEKAYEYDKCIQQTDIIMKTETDILLYRKKASRHKCHCYSKVRILPTVTILFHNSYMHYVKFSHVNHVVCLKISYDILAVWQNV